MGITCINTKFSEIIMDKNTEEEQANLKDEQQFLVSSHSFDIFLMFKEWLTSIILYILRFVEREMLPEMTLGESTA